MPDTNPVPEPLTAEAALRQRLGNAAGGKAARRQTALAIRDLDVTTLEGRQRLRDALVRALAHGDLPARTASTIAAILKDAAADQANDQADLVDKLVARLKDLNDGRS
jgi:hypothetical protein